MSIYQGITRNNLKLPCNCKRRHEALKPGSDARKGGAQ